jgi:excinuclease ABC subunit A
MARASPRAKPSAGTGRQPVAPRAEPGPAERAHASLFSAGAIRLRGARQNNLKAIDLDLPKGRLVAITGVSGSGKSSLAFDTLFREGQRRFLETLSAYARQFLGRMEKPDVDHVEGLCPAIAVDQRAIQRGPRSTVGTLTEIYDHLRVLYARAGVAHCPDHGQPLVAQTPEAVLRQIEAGFAGQKLQLLAPLVRDRKGQHLALFEDLTKRGFVRVRVDGRVLRIEEVPELDRYKRHTVEVVIDRLELRPENQARLREAIGQALELGGGDLVALGEAREQAFSTLRSCPVCGIEAPPLEPRLFSFNSPHGQCERCEGLGLLERPALELLVADPSKSLRQGALAVTRAAGTGLNFPRVDWKFLGAVGEAHGFDLDTPWKQLSERARRVILQGTGEERFSDDFTWNGARTAGTVRFERRFPGVLSAIEQALEKGHKRAQLQRFLTVRPCPECAGTRLNRFARTVQVAGAPLADLTRAAVGELGARLSALPFDPRAAEIAAPLLQEIQRRLRFLVQVGLDYLSLERAADSLSGGEAQRIRLAAQLGAGLQGVLYVLDEPSIGLHARDHGRLLGALLGLRDLGNTVVVVEHDEATLRAADWLVDVGPEAGRGGGRIVAEGPPAEVARADSPTGRLLRGELDMPRPAQRRSGDGRWLELRGAQGFNLKAVDLRLPLGTFAAVSGVSGSGKSTLINRTLAPALERLLGREGPEPAPYGELLGAEAVEDLVTIDAAPIGRTPRSNPATYSGAFGPIRDLFSSLPEAKLRGWEAGRFSFNLEGGRCEACQGAGSQLVELQFLAPVTVPCEECGGHRYGSETLGVRYKGKSIADVLALTIEEALAFFKDLPKIARPLEALVTVGVGYLSLGQPSTTLSGGEAQRIKLAKHLQGKKQKHTLYLLDEPTTGLHGQDVQKLLFALQALVDQGHSVLVIEHNLDLLRAADWLVDLGPEGGQAGGRVLAMGTPELIEATPASHTGAALRAERRARGGRTRIENPLALEPADRLRVIGARTHNLKGIDVELPRDALTVITGPSGSGKSSLALDTIHAAGRQRFVESLSTYARQFLASKDRPPVERIEGLGPSVSVEARTSQGHPRSTVATTTELHDHLRVLWARAGTPRCPTHGSSLERRGASALARLLVERFAGQKGYLTVPLVPPSVREAAGLEREFAARRPELERAGYLRLLLDGAELRLDGPPPAFKDGQRLELVLDRLRFDEDSRPRIVEALDQGAGLAGGRFCGVTQSGERLELALHGACPTCGFALEEPLEPRHFSFNTHVGACPECDGLGLSWQCTPDKLLSDEELPLLPRESGSPTAISGKVGRYLTKGKGYYEHLLRAVAKAHRIDLSKPFAALDEDQRALLLFGRGAREAYSVEIHKEGRNFEALETFTSAWDGLCGAVDGWHKRSEDPEWRAILEGVMQRQPCKACRGERLAPAPRAVDLGGLRLPELLGRSIEAARSWLGQLELPRDRAAAVGPVVGELESRLGLLEQVGLGYLSLDRAMDTLSGGEARRVRLAASLGSLLTGVCYVLDEPTVGLHAADVDRLCGALMALRDLGNTVIVVEHDEELMRRADWLIDMGPGAGRLGGQVVDAGTPAEVIQRGRGATARALRGELALLPRQAARSAGPEIGVVGARLRNLQELDFSVRFGELTGVCGPSGSGKSTLVLECFVPAMRGEKPEGRWKRALGAQGGGRRVVLVDAAPIGRTPASIPSTAAGLMDPLRELFERTPEARLLGLTAASFSFNSPKGRCPACEGRGAIQVEMQFLADLWLTCEECEGRRYRPEVLAIKYRGRSIADVLDLSISEAREFLAHQPSLARILGTLEEVGLGYLGLGQSSTTLSGGEAQRIKLASELLRAEGSQGSVLVLDEPSTGLHAVDLVPLVAVLQRLAERGDAVVVIEHHTGLLAACDRLVELGPAGGAAGGRLVAQGSVAELARDPNSLTGRFLEVRRERVETAASLAPRGRRRAAPESAAEAGAEPRAAGSARTAQAKAAVPAAGSGRGRAAAKAGPKSAPKSAAKTATKAAAKPAAKAATKSVPKAVASSAVKTAGGAAPAPRRGPKGRAKPGGGGRP